MCVNKIEGMLESLTVEIHLTFRCQAIFCYLRDDKKLIVSGETVSFSGKGVIFYWKIM